MTQTVLVSGATSQLGVFLLPRLTQAGFSVLALSRRIPAGCERSGVRWHRLDPESGSSGEPPGWERTSVRHLVSCGPLDLALALVRGHRGLKRVVAFSTSSVVTKVASRNRAEGLHMACIREDEERLKARCEKDGIALLLLRPTQIYGCGLDRNISLLASFGERFGIIPLAGKAAGLRQPVHADDLAAVTVSALLAEQAVNLESVACGGSTLAYGEMVQRIATACGDGVRTFAVPAALLSVVVRVISVLPAFRGVNAEMVRRQSIDMVFDDEPLRSALGFQPRSFEPRPEDFKIPPQAERFQPGT
jgi:nucleoside-diphosphate-sugar epimerase